MPIPDDEGKTVKDSIMDNDFLNEIDKRIHDEGKIFRRLIRLWLLSPTAITIGMLLVFLGLTAVSPLTIQSIQKVTLSENIGPTVFGATVTTLGLVTGFIPIISFFLIADVREARRETKGFFETKLASNNPTKKEIFRRLLVLQNLEKEVLKYTEVAILFSIFSIFLLVALYVMISRLDLVLLILFHSSVLLFAVFEIFPLVRIGLRQNYSVEIIRTESGEEIPLILRSYEEFY